MIPLIVSYVLNIIDYLFTACWVGRFGIDVESNPIGRWMFQNNVAGLYKIIIVGCLFAVLGYFTKRNRKAAWVAYIPLVAYSIIIVYHLEILLLIKEVL
jgi:hypothetical protein